MNTNRDASQQTKYNKAKVLAVYHKQNVRPLPGTYSDTSSSTQTEVVLGKTLVCPTNTISNNTIYTIYYIAFTISGSSTWTAPTTCQSPITYWIVGGGGGGGAAFDNAGGGGGGGGVAITGTYAIVAGTTYDIVVGDGGAGGTARGSSYPNPTVNPGTQTNGTAGTNSSFDVSNGGPVAAGGGAGLNSRNAPGGSGLGGGISLGGNGGGGGNCGGGGGGAGGNGTNGSGSIAGTGGPGILFTIPGYNGGVVQSYGIGGNGGVDISTILSSIVGASGSVNRGNGGGGGSAGSYSPPSTGGVITIGGDGGSGLVVIQYSA
jgi:hypothetical protein